MNHYSTYTRDQYQQDLRYCRYFIFHFSSNYSLGTRLFNKRVREATYIYYAFVRYADELVDNPNIQMPGQTHSNVKEFISDWKKTIHEKPDEKTHPILRSHYWLFQKYNIPFEYSFDFLGAMKQDLHKTRFKTYKELRDYMWGSAGVVGHVMAKIIGYGDEVALEYAQDLGEAMQLANFLRDLDEDYSNRNRIYLAEEDMDLFGVNEEIIKNKKMTHELRQLIKFYIEKTETLFQKGIDGISYLDSGKFSILVASYIYRENIKILKKRNYNVFGKKIGVSVFKKILILISTLVYYPFWLLKDKH